MASARNDALRERTVEGSINYYDNHRCKGTADDKALAARLGGHSYNILSNQDKHEIYFRNMRNQNHYLDKKGRHTREFFGARRRKFDQDERGHVVECLRGPDDHPREKCTAERRTAMQLSQMENANSWVGFQDRMGKLYPERAPRRYTINNKLYCNEADKLRVKTATKEDWMSRRGEPMMRAASCPSLALSDTQRGLTRSVAEDARKEATQRQTESAHFAPWQTAHTYANSMESTEAGRRMAAAHDRCSVNRLENYDFAVSRKNNHFSSQDKLSRSDAYFMRPRLSTTNNSVKYDIVSNERRWFKYN
eukprot:TRINITY_DN273_c1_g1_i1.p1 TRINITY_DN273_c1_g1~~TRINITY_DN273_c1_g1_i1.p1  ORF type:complete len:307 (-),score=61.30 TRINITY_DN273_c1_g1_i1:54-974(-)